MMLHGPAVMLKAPRRWRQKSSLQLAATRAPNRPTTSMTPSRALATPCTRATARAIRVQDALSHRETFDKPILGQLRSSAMLVSNFKGNMFQIHHIVPSANVTFRLTLPRRTALWSYRLYE